MDGWGEMVRPAIHLSLQTELIKAAAACLLSVAGLTIPDSNTYRQSRWTLPATVVNTMTYLLETQNYTDSTMYLCYMHVSVSFSVIESDLIQLTPF